MPESKDTRYILNPMIKVSGSKKKELYYIQCNNTQFVVTQAVINYLAEFADAGSNIVSFQDNTVELSKDKKEKTLEYLLLYGIVLDNGNQSSRYIKDSAAPPSHFFDYITKLTTKRKILSANTATKIGNLFRFAFRGYLPAILFFISVALIVCFFIFAIVQFGFIIDPEQTIYSFSICFPVTILLTVMVSPLHEFGHLGAARASNIDVGEVGIGIYLTSFSLYTNLNSVNTADKKTKLLVDIGGLLMEALVVGLLFCVAFAANSIFIFAVAIEMFFSMGINLNPFSKTDGYWFISDYCEIPNMHIRAGELVKRIKTDKKLQIKTKMEKRVALYCLFCGVIILFYGIASILVLPVYIVEYPGILEKYANNIAMSLTTGQIFEMLLNCYLIIMALIPIIGIIILIIRAFRYFARKSEK